MENIKAMMEFTEVLKNEPDKAYDFFTVNAYRFEKTDLENILKEILCSLNYHINNNFYGKLLGDILGDVQIELDEDYDKQYEKYSSEVEKLNRGYYIYEYNSFWKKCLEDAEEKAKDIQTYGENFDIQLEATEHFEECANAAQVVGYYLVYHEENSLTVWKNNIEGRELTNQDKEITKILERIFA